MTYHFSKIVDMPFDKAVAATTEVLKKHGFGVLTQIDVRDTLHKKLGIEFRPYLILGACNPKLAHQALTVEDKIGTMLPLQRGRSTARRQPDRSFCGQSGRINERDRQSRAFRDFSTSREPAEAGHCGDSLVLSQLNNEVVSSTIRSHLLSTRQFN